MPKFKLRLTHTPKGANPNHKFTVEQRREKGRDSAKSFNVTVDHIIGEIDGATWFVEGQERDVDDMIDDWVNPIKKKANVTVVKTPI
jgi:hypothetical protein